MVTVIIIKTTASNIMHNWVHTQSCVQWLLLGPPRAPPPQKKMAIFWEGGHYWEVGPKFKVGFVG